MRATPFSTPATPTPCWTPLDFCKSVKRALVGLIVSGDRSELQRCFPRRSLEAGSLERQEPGGSLRLD